jgi:hypothetical protein
MPRLQLDRISQRETAGPAGPQNLSRALLEMRRQGTDTREQKLDPVGRARSFQYAT